MPEGYLKPHAGRTCQNAATFTQRSSCMCVRTSHDHSFISVGSRDGQIHILRPPDQQSSSASRSQELREVYCLQNGVSGAVSFGNIPSAPHAPSEPRAQVRATLVGLWTCKLQSRCSSASPKIQCKAVTWLWLTQGTPKAPIAALAWRTPTPSSQNILLAAQGNTVLGHHVTTGKQVSSVSIAPSEQGEENILSMAASQTGSQVAVGGAHGSVHVFDSRGTTLQHCLKFGQVESAANALSSTSGHGHTSRVFALHWHSSDDHLLFSGGWDNTVQACFSVIADFVRGSCDSKLWISGRFTCLATDLQSPAELRLVNAVVTADVGHAREPLSALHLWTTHMWQWNCSGWVGARNCCLEVEQSTAAVGHWLRGPHLNTARPWCR